MSHTRIAVDPVMSASVYVCSYYAEAFELIHTRARHVSIFNRLKLSTSFCIHGMVQKLLGDFAHLLVFNDLALLMPIPFSAAGHMQ